MPQNEPAIADNVFRQAAELVLDGALPTTALQGKEKSRGRAAYRHAPGTLRTSKRCSGFLAVTACAGALLTGCTTDPATPAALAQEDQKIAALPELPSGTVREITRNVPAPMVPPPDMSLVAHPAGKGYLTGPHFGLKIAWVATGRAITDHPANPPASEPVRAAPGQELLVFQVDPAIRTGHWVRRDTDQAPVAELVVAGVPTKLAKLPLRPSTGRFTPPRDGLLVVAGVPVGAPATVRVTDAGRTQTVDVRTGLRASDAITGYYRKTTRKLAWRRDDVPIGVSVAGHIYRGTLDLGLRSYAPSRILSDPAVLLTPYTPSNGWAAPGRAWLTVPRPTLSGNVLPGPLLTLKVDDPTSFQLRLPDGTVLPAAPGSRQTPITLGSLGDPGPDLTFDVPADFRTGTYVMRLDTAAVIGEYRNAKLPARWTPAPGTAEIPIDLN